MEHNLWADFIDGKPKAFEAIYNTNVDSLFAYGMKIYPDYDLVKDCIQDVFIDMFENRNRISSPNNLKFYLFKVLKRTIFRKIKKERIYGDLEEQKRELFNPNYDIETTTIANEIDNNKSILITECLKALTSRQQEILHLRFIIGFTYQEISEIIDIDHNSVRKQVYRAIKKIRESDAFKNNINIILYLSFHI